MIYVTAVCPSTYGLTCKNPSRLCRKASGTHSLFNRVEKRRFPIHVEAYSDQTMQAMYVGLQGTDCMAYGHLVD
jgi:hypothetical protein